MDLKTLQDWVIARRFRAVSGVIDVTGWGGKTKTFEIQIDRDKLIAYGLTLPQALQTLSNSNINVGGNFAESRGLPGASARERFKELVLNALAAEKPALKEIAHEPENTSIAEPAGEPAAAPDDADGVLVDSVVVEFKS